MLKTDADGRRADGRLRSVLAYNHTMPGPQMATIPGPQIVICEGDTLKVNFLNNITGNLTNADGSSNTTTLHFHGIREKLRPWSDGVPFVSQFPLLPGERFTSGFNTGNNDIRWAAL
jgi:FtsP/CotA-like multicopper oxidase with cupredoxin domain